MSKLPEPPETYARGWLDQLDGRTGIAQAMRARWDAFTSDLGGAHMLSYMQLSLVERALWLEYWLAQQESQLAAGEAFEVGKWVQAANSLQGILSKLGLHRAVKDIPDLSEYIARRAG